MYYPSLPPPAAPTSPPAPPTGDLPVWIAALIVVLSVVVLLLLCGFAYMISNQNTRVERRSEFLNARASVACASAPCGSTPSLAPGAIYNTLPACSTGIANASIRPVEHTTMRAFGRANKSFVRSYRIPIVVRTVIIRLVLSKMLVTGVLAFLGFLATDSLDKKFLASLSVVVNMVAYYHYNAILNIRDQSNLPSWMSLKGPQQVVDKPAEGYRDEYDPLEPGEKMQLQEMAVDVLRHSD